MKLFIVMCVMAAAVAMPIFDHDDDDVSFFVRSPDTGFGFPQPFFRSSWGIGASPYIAVDDDVRAIVTPVHTDTVRKVDKVDDVRAIVTPVHTETVRKVDKVDEVATVDVKPFEYDTTFHRAGYERAPVVKKTYKQPVVYKQYFYYD